MTTKHKMERQVVASFTAAMEPPPPGPMVLRCFFFWQAMKMEHQVVAPIDGRVSAVLCEVCVCVCVSVCRKGRARVGRSEERKTRTERGRPSTRDGARRARPARGRRDFHPHPLCSAFLRSLLLTAPRRRVTATRRAPSFSLVSSLWTRQAGETLDDGAPMVEIGGEAEAAAEAA